jgi:hypothetical protein
MADVVRITGLHKNTIRNYVQRGELKGKKIDEGLGKQKWVIDEEDLRLCDIPQIARHFSGKSDRAYLTEQEQKEKEYLRKIRDQEQTIMELSRRLSENTKKLNHLELTTSESFMHQKIINLESEAKDLAYGLYHALWFVSKRRANYLWQWKQIGLEVYDAKFYLCVGGNRIEYTGKRARPGDLQVHGKAEDADA